MATDQEQRPCLDEANLQPSATEVPPKSGDVAVEAPEEKRQSAPSETETPAADAIVFKNDIPGIHENEIPIDGGYFETESNESSASSTPRDEKAVAFQEARQERVEVEANAYLESETRKVNARAHAAQVLADKRKMHEEAKALELKKREELRAEQLQRDAEVKADKIVENAKQEAAKLKTHVYERTERSIADATARAERDKAAEEEARRIGIAELVSEVQQMKTSGELPAHEKKGMITRLKEKVVGHHI